MPGDKLLNILYLENHAVFAAQVTQQFLSAHAVSVVASLSAARNAWEPQAFDLVLVDYDLADGKGVDFVREVRARNAETPIIGVSSHEPGNEALLNAGASAICSKMDFDNICSVIETLIPGVRRPEKRNEVPVGEAQLERTIGGTRLRLVTGDIADQDTDAVVTAAHWRLNKGLGTDGTIHSKGGPAIYEECQKIGGCPIGEAVITTGGTLKAKYVIHAVGPVWHGGSEDEALLLANAYRRSLELAMQNRLKSIAFPSISTGAFGYPLRLAAPVALRTICEFLEKERHGLEEVRMVLYNREQDTAFQVFAQALGELRPADGARGRYS
jgi:O-acetyl-ADP-ribose deacetylase (regulator of RNase III)/ActR/RegA family two-component response regulator